MEYLLEHFAGAQLYRQGPKNADRAGQI